MGLHVKHREIVFNSPQTESHPAHSAVLLLTSVEGIEKLSAIDSHHLLISYNILHLTFADIEMALQLVGYHLDNSLLVKLKRALYHYTEETERSNLGCASGQCKCTRDVFIKHYARKEHGCRDPRPEHWRDYR